MDRHFVVMALMAAREHLEHETTLNFVGRQQGDVDRLDGLRVIGVDELSYRRHHEYVIVVVDHERGTIVWVLTAEPKAAEGQVFGLAE